MPNGSRSNKGGYGSRKKKSGGFLKGSLGRMGSSVSQAAKQSASQEVGRGAKHAMDKKEGAKKSAMDFISGLGGSSGDYIPDSPVYGVMGGISNDALKIMSSSRKGYMAAVMGGKKRRSKKSRKKSSKRKSKKRHSTRRRRRSSRKKCR
uniref:Uncharacterized protein n=1 Tax=viral metagenome TaxID=1070528 RepID=A0A6C0LLC9_9ZZZZ